jgi:hypothetical protein
MNRLSLGAFSLAAQLTATAGIALAAPAATVSAIATPDMLGAQIAYLESKAGPAFKVDGPFRTYRLEGCDLGVISTDGSSISAFRVPVTAGCAGFDLAAFLPNYTLPAFADLTFGAFDAQAVGGTYTSDCITGCGNATDPFVTDRWTGSHADNFIEVALEAELISDDVIDAAFKWADIMRAAEGEDYVLETKFNCDGKYNEKAVELFAKVRPTAVTIGTLGPNPITCP